jgi:hypothetical protein
MHVSPGACRISCIELFPASAIVIIESEQMQRVDLYIKVEVELDEDETPERIANEICRMLQKLYYVRSAELSSAVPRD